MVKIFPSLIASNLLRLQETLELLDPYVQGYHLDVMDFHFVPNLTWGPDFINALRAATNKQLFIHLMVDYPENYFNLLHLQPRDIISFHYESPSRFTCENLYTEIASRGLIPSIALNPETPVSVLSSLPTLQHLLLMSVHPGFSGQQFIPSTLEKLAESVAFRTTHTLSFTIAVDGGITEENCRALVQGGADELAIATAIFKDDHPREAVQRIVSFLQNSAYPIHPV